MRRTLPFALCLLPFALAAQSAPPGPLADARGSEQSRDRQGAVSGVVRQPPKTRTDNVKEVLHGAEIVDPYRWLEDQKSPETRAWIDAQNQYTRSLLDPLPGRAELEKRQAALMKIDTTSMPRARGGRYFFTKRRADQEQSVLFMRRGLSGKDEMLVDPHPMSADRTTSVMFRGFSKDGTLAAYAIRQGGEDEVAIRFLNVDTRKELPDVLPKARYGGLSMKHDKSGFYYSRRNPDGYRLYYHGLGAASDPEIFGKGYGPEWGVSGVISEDGRYLVIHTVRGSAADDCEIYVQDLARGGPIVPIVRGIQGRFFGEAAGDTLYVHTNWQAPKGRVLAIDLKSPAREKWREVIPESSAVIDGVSLAGGRLFVNYLENVRSSLRVFSAEGQPLGEIPVPALGSVSGMNGDWDRDEAFYSFSSFHIAGAIYRYEVSTGKQSVWWKPNIPVNSEDFEVKQVWYESKDGTRVPMFLLHRKGVKLDGERPTLLTGYGGFNMSNTPGFRAAAVLWAERGGVYAVANLRGGGEFGEEWHKAGMLDHKQNVFDDFIAAAEWLVANRFSKPARLAIQGGSNGGLLVGAAMTQRPELFGAVVCTYPLLDMVRYHKFLLARLWVPEYGSAENPEQFRYIHAYSPYHRVRPGTKYPAALFVTGDSDTRVDPLHARKMAALVQAATGSDKPVLLLYDTKTGHSGGMPVSRQIEDGTDILSFLWSQVGAAR
ncbi:MAG: S9 family peptidase [Acidobacteria bacterium]|nr:S9 family peptidase [Acidobacteriota bacterium]